jgi:hypothetical protein
MLPFKMSKNVVEYALNLENENVGSTCDILNMSSKLQILFCNV